MSATFHIHASIGKDDFLVISDGAEEHKIAVKHCLAAPELLTALEYLVAFDDPTHPKHVALCEFLIDEMARTEQEIPLGQTRKFLLEIARAAITKAIA